MSDDVQETITKLAGWFEIRDTETFREGVFAMLVGIADADEFIKLSQEKFGLPLEDAENLFGEVGDRILDQAHTIFEKALDQAEKDGVQKNPVPKPAVVPASVIPANSVPSQSPKTTPPTENRRFIGVPFYGVEKPASSYTSILPRSTIDMNKNKETPTAESLMKKVGMLAEKPGNKVSPASIAPPLAVPPKVPVMNEPLVPIKSSSTRLSSNLPVLESEESSVQLSKLVLPTNIPRQESKQQFKQEIKTMPEAPKPPVQTVPSDPLRAIPSANISIGPKPPVAIPPPTPVPKAPPTVPYTAGQDPYRETPVA